MILTVTDGTETTWTWLLVVVRQLYGMSSGSFISYTLTIAYQDTAHFIWQAGGSYTSECTYKVKDAYGTDALHFTTSGMQ